MMPAFTLVLEASTPRASVALLSGEQLVADVAVVSHDPATGMRLEGVMPAVDDCCRQAQTNPTHLSSIVCSAGPGSFTSLRSAAAIAKGFCSVLDIPLYGVSSMELLIASARLSPGVYVPAIDAGRGEYYSCVVEVAEDSITPTTPITLLSRASLDLSARERHARVVGLNLDIDVFPQASAASLILHRILETDPVPLDTWEPWYGRLAEAQVKWEAAHGRPLSL